MERGKPRSTIGTYVHMARCANKPFVRHIGLGILNIFTAFLAFEPVMRLLVSETKILENREVIALPAGFDNTTYDCR